MGKIFDSINGLIMDSMKSKNTEKTNAYKNLKAKMLEFKTAKDAKPLDDAAEIRIIKKMVNELKNDADVFEKNGRNDLSAPALAEADILSNFLPVEASDSEIEAVIDRWCNENGSIDKKSMGKVMSYVKTVLPNSDGSKVASIVRSKM